MKLTHPAFDVPARVTAQRDWLVALNNTTRHLYAGTVAPEVVAHRRTRNKVARRSRRINRRTA